MMADNFWDSSRHACNWFDWSAAVLQEAKPVVVLNEVLMYFSAAFRQLGRST